LVTHFNELFFSEEILTQWSFAYRKRNDARMRVCLRVCVWLRGFWKHINLTKQI